MSFRDHFGLKDPDSIIPRIATGFGVGIAKKGRICGALIGANMVIGMKLGRKHPKDYEAVGKTFAKVDELWDRFEKEFGSSECNTITGLNMSKPENINLWITGGARQKCRDMVEKTAQMLCEILEGA